MVVFHFFLSLFLFSIQESYLFLRLILYASTLLEVFQLCEFSGGYYKDTYVYTIMSSSNNGNLTSFQYIPLISPSCPITLVRSSSTILNNYSESGHICLVLEFRRHVLSFCSFDLMLPIGFLYIAFIMFLCTLFTLISLGFLS